MIDENPCMHFTHVVVMRREGSKVNPKIFMVEECMDCQTEFDRKKVSRASGVYASRNDK